MGMFIDWVQEGPISGCVSISFKSHVPITSVVQVREMKGSGKLVTKRIKILVIDILHREPKMD